MDRHLQNMPIWVYFVTGVPPYWTTFVRDLVLPGNSHFQCFLLIYHFINQKQSETKVLMSLTFPGCWNPDFISKFLFFKKCIFGMCKLWGIYGSKNFSIKIVSRIWFCPETVIAASFLKSLYIIFSSLLIAMDFYSLFRLVY